MEIDDGRRILCMVATSEDDPTWVELYRIDGVLLLQDYKGELQGHPGIDLENIPAPDGGQWCGGYHLHKSTVNKIKRWTERGLFVALSSHMSRKWQRNQLNPDYQTEDKIDKHESLVISWAKPDKCLTESQLNWVQAYSDSSFVYTDGLEAQASRAAWAIVFNAIAEIGAAQKPRAKQKKRVKRKERRRRETDYYAIQ